MNATRIFTGHDMVRRAEARIRPHIRETPLEPAPILENGEGSVWLKLENQQVTGSFKARGAINRMLTLSDDEKVQGVVAASSGNHGLAIACAAELCGVRATVFVPNDVDPSRKRALERCDVEFRLFGDNYGQTEQYAIDVARKTGRTFISSYDDPDVVAGQGTIAVELQRQLPALDTVILAVGGGALVSGVGAYLKASPPEVQIVGVSPSNSPMMFDLLAGTPEELSVVGKTIADSTAGPVQPGAITVDLCRALVDQWILVEEEEITGAVNYLFYEHRLVTEGAGAMAVAAYLKEQDRYKDRNCALVVCGGNIDPKRFLTLL